MPRPVRAKPADPIPVDPNDHADAADIADAVRHLDAAAKRIAKARAEALLAHTGNYLHAGNACIEIEGAELSVAKAEIALRAATGCRI